MKIFKLYRELLRYKLHMHDTHVQLEQVQQSIQSLSDQVEITQRVICQMASEQENRAKNINQLVETTGNIEYNIRTNMNETSQNDEYKKILQSQLSDYEKDLHLKLMRKYVVDSIISFYVMVLDLTRSQGITSDISERFILEIENDLNKIGINVHKSSHGDSFDSYSMRTGIFSNVKTTDKQLVGKVAQSIYPSFVWNLPTIGVQSSSLILKEEIVTLYEL